MTRSKKFRLPLNGIVTIPVNDNNYIKISLQVHPHSGAPGLAVMTPPGFEVLQARKDCRTTIRNQSQRFTIDLKPDESDYPDSEYESEESESEESESEEFDLEMNEVPVADVTVTYNALDE